MHTFRFTLTCRVLLEQCDAELAEHLNRPDVRLCDNHFRTLHLEGNGQWEAVPVAGQGIRVSDDCEMIVEHVSHSIYENTILVFLDGADYRAGDAEEAIKHMHHVAQCIMGLAPALAGWEIRNAAGFVIDELPEPSDFTLQVLTINEPEDA